jgi:predicted  nucleic acid-binding Zn-ribbon protein
MASKFTEEDLEYISNYLAEKYPAIKGNTDQYRYSDIKIDIHERIVRVEEELKHQRELIHEVLKMMDKRFEQVDKRFEQVDKRFEECGQTMNNRFEEMRSDRTIAFEQVDKRFEYTHADMNRRFNMMMWFTGIGFTLITTIITGQLLF